MLKGYMLIFRNAEGYKLIFRNAEGVIVRERLGTPGLDHQFLHGPNSFMVTLRLRGG